MLVMIIGCVGLALNIISAVFVGHGQSPPSSGLRRIDVSG